VKGDAGRLWGGVCDATMVVAVVHLWNARWVVEAKNQKLSRCGSVSSMSCETTMDNGGEGWYHNVY
jgi:hypothetical protein